MVEYSAHPTSSIALKSFSTDCRNFEGSDYSGGGQVLDIVVGLHIGSGLNPNFTPTLTIGSTILALP